jgi:hypothetical protein
MSMGEVEDESSTGCIWAAGFHHVKACSHLARVLKLMNRLFILFSIFFSGDGKPLVTETADTESADMGARLYIFFGLFTFSSDKNKLFCTAVPLLFHSIHDS